MTSRSASSRHLSWSPAVASPCDQDTVQPNENSVPSMAGPSVSSSSLGIISGGEVSGTLKGNRRKRRRLDLRVTNEKREGRKADEQTSEEEEEEVDELLSDDGDQAAISTHLAQRSLPGISMTDNCKQSQGQVDLINPVARANMSSSVLDQHRSTITSPSLAKILHTTNIEPHKPTKTSSPPSPNVPIASAPISHRAPSTSPLPLATQRMLPPAHPEPELLSSYTCPICFSSPTNATLTPCGHICCGSCLFTAVKTTMQRTALMMAEQAVARCPVCRAPIPGWDGRGGGVIGLKVRAVFSL